LLSLAIVCLCNTSYACGHSFTIACLRMSFLLWENRSFRSTYLPYLLRSVTTNLFSKVCNNVAHLQPFSGEMLQYKMVNYDHNTRLMAQLMVFEEKSLKGHTQVHPQINLYIFFYSISARPSHPVHSSARLKSFSRVFS